MLKKSIIACALILAGIGVLARAETPDSRTDYWINTDDSTIVEIIMPDTSAASPPDDGDWDQITLEDIHDLGRMSPGEGESLAYEQGHYWEIPTLGGNTVEWGWYVVGQNTTQKWVASGAGSRRIWYKLPPGRVYAKTVLRRNGAYWQSSVVNKGFGWEAKAQTWPNYYYPRESTYVWTDSTEHWYGGINWIYHVWPEVIW